MISEKWSFVGLSDGINDVKIAERHISWPSSMTRNENQNFVPAALRLL